MGKINKLSEIPNLAYKLVKEIFEMEKQCFFVNVFNYTNELFLNDNIDFKKVLLCFFSLHSFRIIEVWKPL